MSHILETALTHATDYDGKMGFSAKYKYRKYICYWKKC